MNSKLQQLFDDYLDNYAEHTSLYSYIRFYAPNIVSDIRGAFSFLTSELSPEEKIEILKKSNAYLDMSIVQNYLIFLMILIINLKEHSEYIL